MLSIFRIKTVCALLLAILSAGPAWAQSGNYRHEVVIYDNGQGINLSGPAGVSCDGERIIVADTRNSRLLVYTLIEGVLSVDIETKLTRQIRPTTVQAGVDGDMLVYDSRGKELLRFNAAGTLSGKVVPENVPGKSKVILKSFRVDSAGSIYLLDVFGRRVVVLDKTGAYIKQISFPAEFGFFSDLAVDDRGRVFILDSIQSQVFTAAPEEDVFTPLSDSLRDDLAYPTHLEVDSSGLLYVVDEETSTIGILRRDGSFAKRLFNRGRKEGLLYYPSQICVGDGSRLVIADRDNNRVQVFVEKE